MFGLDLYTCDSQSFELRVSNPSLSKHLERSLEAEEIQH